MRVECFIIADGAQVANGKLFVLGGGWSVLYAKEFPCVHPNMALAIKLAVPWTDTNLEHQFRIELVDEDAKPIIPKPLEGTFSVGRPLTVRPGDDLDLPVAFNVNNLQIPTEGRYWITLFVNDRELAKVPFRARRP